MAKASAPQSAVASSAPAGVLGRLSRGRARALMAVVGVVGLGLLGGAAALYWLKEPEVVAPLNVSRAVAEALAAIDAGDDARVSALARQLLAAEHLGEHLGVPPFLLGVVAAREAATLEGDTRQARYAVAALYLAEAEQSGFPPTHAELGWICLGKSYFASGQVMAARDTFLKARESLETPPVDLCRYLADCLRYQAVPDWNGALEEITAYLADAALTAADRARGLLTKAHIELGMQRETQAEATLAGIAADAIPPAERTLVEGRLALARATRAMRTGDGAAEGAIRDFDRALALFRQVQRQASFPDPAAAEGMLREAMCQRAMGDVKVAWKQFERIQGMYPNSFESFAAAALGADCLAQLGDHDEALVALRAALDRIPPIENYVNPYLSHAQLGDMMTGVYDAWLVQERFASAVELAERLKPLISNHHAEELTARALVRWGRRLADQAAKAPTERREELTIESREKFRLAGASYLRLAEHEFTTPKYTDDLWMAADYLFAGQDYEATVDVLRQYLAAEPVRNRPRALVRLAESLLTLSRTEETLVALDECIQFHEQDPSAFKARLLAATTHIERGEFERAEKLLLDNLNGDALTPAAIEWRDSLFELGMLMHEQKRYAEASVRLEEAIARYPDAEQAAQARYLAAEAYTKEAIAFSQTASPIASVRQTVSRSQEVERLWQAALVHFEKLAETLNERQQTRGLDALERTLLRNCDFSRGGALFRLGRYQEAIRAYSLVTSRYQDSPEVLDAFLQIAECCRRLGRESEAKSTVEQAKLVLNRMGTDTDYQRTTNYDQPTWAKVLNGFETQ